MTSHVPLDPRRRLNRVTVFIVMVAIASIAMLMETALGLYRDYRERQVVRADPTEAEMKSAASRGEMCGPLNPLGTGLKVDFFSREDLKGVSDFSRSGEFIDLDPKVDWPKTKSGPPYQSARWSGWVKPPSGGRYTFHCEGCGARIVVAKTVVKDEPIELAGGRFYQLVVEVERLSKVTGPIRVEWTTPHGSRYVLPRSMLYPPSEKVSSIK